MEAFRTLRHLGHVSELTIELAAIAGERPEGGSFIGIQTVMGNLVIPAFFIGIKWTPY